MGSQPRRDKQVAGLPVENAEAVRRRRRQEASIMREELAIELWAQGKTAKEISEELFRRFGVKLTSNIPELVRRGLYRRVEQGKQEGYAETARELFREYYMQLLQKWMPRAIGAVTDPDTGLASPPDPRAAEIVMRILRDFGVVEGVVAPPRGGDLNLTLLNGIQLDDGKAQEQVLASLRAERDKQLVIEGTLSETPAVESAISDGMVPPPKLPKRPD